MSNVHRREVLCQLLSGLLRVGGAAAVVLVSGTIQAGVPGATGDEPPLPELDPNQPQPTDPLQQRVEQAAANLNDIVPPGAEGDEDSWINAGFRNAGFRNASFRNGGFVNGGGFRNGGFVNGGGGGFRNGSFRNW